MMPGAAILRSFRDRGDVMREELLRFDSEYDQKFEEICESNRLAINNWIDGRLSDTENFLGTRTLLYDVQEGRLYQDYDVGGDVREYNQDLLVIDSYSADLEGEKLEIDEYIDAFVELEANLRDNVGAALENRYVQQETQRLEQVRGQKETKEQSQARNGTRKI